MGSSRNGDARALCPRFAGNAVPWDEWLCHSNFSFLVGASHPEDLVRTAVAHQYRTLALSDMDGVYGLARAWRELRKLRRDGLDGALRLAYGAEFHLAQDHDLPLILQDTITLLARDRAGYATVCRLSSEAHREGKHAPWLREEVFNEIDLSGCVALIPMRGLIRQGKITRLSERLARLQSLFGERLYMTLSRHLHPSEDAWIPATTSLAETLRVKTLAAQDAYFHEPAQKIVSDLVTAIRRNETLDSTIAQMFPNAERCLRDRQTLSTRYGVLPHWPAMRAHSEHLAASLQFDLSELRYRYPRELVPEGKDSHTWLAELVTEGCQARWPEGTPAPLRETLAKELDLVRQLDFADYFLTVHDIVRYARSQDILCQGRGSAANSAICFVLGITAVDPTRFELLFERFLSAERGDPPDIDVDFEHERREEVIQYIYRRFGRARAAMVANVITFRRRGALREAGKALGIPESLLEKGSEAMDFRRFRHEAPAETLARVTETSTDIHPRAALWMYCAEKLRGFPRHLGIHSGGFILSDQPIDSLTGVEPATMEGRTVIQWSKNDIEALGFFKIDILALGMLSAIRKTFDLIRASGGAPMRMIDIPPDDKPTYAMIQRAETVGVFQIESRGQMSMLPRLKPKCFYDLVIEVAIIRPGPIEGGLIGPFLRRREGLEPVVIPDERLVPILQRTLGVPLFQEQVMRVAMALGQFTAGEADELRRKLGSWSFDEEELLPWLDRLEHGLKNNGLDEHFTRTIMGQLKAFASYGFPESHAASFALLAYVSSWLKCHHPAAFFAALLNSQPMGFYSPHVLLQTARHVGVVVLPVCVNRSQADCSLEYDPSSRGGLALRLGLSMTRGLRQEAIQSLVKARPDGGWKSFSAFLATASLPRADATCLAAADAFHHFELARRDALWATEAFPVASILDAPTLLEHDLFNAESPWERALSDMTHTQTTLGDHPAQIVRAECWPYAINPSALSRASDFSRLAAGREITVFGMVQVKQSPPTAKGMCFFTLEDETGLMNLVVTPDTYATYDALLDRQPFLCVSGILESRGEAFSLKVRQVHAPQRPEARVTPLPVRAWM